MAVKQPSKRTHYCERSNQRHPFGGCGGGCSGGAGYGVGGCGGGAWTDGSGGDVVVSLVFPGGDEGGVVGVGC
nr:hypothetical protein [Tanacetum cinerariifolium]